MTGTCPLRRTGVGARFDGRTGPNGGVSTFLSTMCPPFVHRPDGVFVQVEALLSTKSTYSTQTNLPVGDMG